MSEQDGPKWLDGFNSFVEEFKGESDRAAVILGAAKIDALLSQLLDRFLLPSLATNDELLDGDSPLSTFSSRINACYRVGLIDASFAKTLHIVRKIRNAFAHDVAGVSLQSGAHADRVKSLLLPLHPLPFFSQFREHFFGAATHSNNFRACLALMTGRLEAILESVTPLGLQHDSNFILDGWSEEYKDKDAQK